MRSRGLDFPGKTALLAGALGIAMFPPISTVGPLFDMWSSIGLYDTWPGLIIPYLSFSLPLAIYVLVAFFREIPWELEQAAQVDGATPLQAFRRVIVPLAAPGVFTAAILVFIFRLERLPLRDLADQLGCVEGPFPQRSPSSPAIPSSPNPSATSPPPQ